MILEGELSVDWAGEQWLLLPDRALFRYSSKLLIITDPHFGKDAVFRAHGIPVPEGTTATDLLRLDALIDRLVPNSLLLLGDFFHGRASRSLETLAALNLWRRRNPSLEVINIFGNHDKHSGTPPQELDIKVIDEPLRSDGVSFSHYPGCCEGPLVSGHLHPGISLRLHSRQNDKTPCFWMSNSQLVLPAFGGFTGRASIVPGSGDRIFAVAEGEIVEVPSQLWRRPESTRIK